METIKLRQAVLEKVFERMNPRQQEAVFHTQGPLLLLAGAGSGKTTVLVNRIANLVRFGQAYRSPFVRQDFSPADAAACEAYLAGKAPLPPDTEQHLAVSPCLPWKIMAITFTNKAAGELKERLTHMLGEAGREIWASTFHASCARILRRDGSALGFSNHFTIYDADDSLRLMKACMQEEGIDKDNIKPKEALREISRAKDQLISPEAYREAHQDDYRKAMIGRLYRRYQSMLFSGDAMDFDDLIYYTVRLFEKSQETLIYYQNRFRYMMIDEYQDTNIAQYRFISLLAEGHRNLCVVGDDDQSIYKFRGATIENILGFEKDYQAEVIRLEQNYRSTQTILDAANAVIRNNVERKGKNLWTDNGGGDPIRVSHPYNVEEEAQKAAEEILSQAAKGRKFSDFAILYRMNAQSAAFERIFSAQGIPHRILGGIRFYERQEVKDMMAYLCVINNPNDTVRMRRIINQPKRSIGTATMDKLQAIAQEEGLPLFQVISNPESYPALSRAAKKLRGFAEMLRSLMDLNADPTVGLSELYRALLEKTNFPGYLVTTDGERGTERRDNVYELGAHIQQFEKKILVAENWYPTDGEDSAPSGNPEDSPSVRPASAPVASEPSDDAAPSIAAPDPGADPPQTGPRPPVPNLLSSFLEEVSLLSDVDNYDAQADAVTLMTIHSAKGLEFPCVFLPGMEEGVFPGMAVMYNPKEAEEERRLAYVAITRAKEQLFISAAKSRMLFGSTTQNPPSRFLLEIPEALIQEEEETVSSFDDDRFDFGQGRPSAGRPSKLPPKPPAKKKNPDYRPGDLVSHNVFGTGKILNVHPMGGDQLLEIAFQKSGTKKIFASFAQLSKL